MHHMLVYGLQRSGTNYLETLLPNNFKDVSMENMGFARSLPVHKHFRPYDEKWFVPEPKYLNNFFYPHFSDFDAHVRRLTGKEPLHYVVTVKEPFSWYVSYCKEAGKSRWPSLVRKGLSQHYMIEYSLFCRKWLDFRGEAPAQVIILRYEDLLKDLAGSLDRVREQFGLEKAHETYQDFSKVNKSSRFSLKRRTYYLNKQFLDLFSKEDLFLLRENLNPDVVKELGYELGPM